MSLRGRAGMMTAVPEHDALPETVRRVLRGQIPDETPRHTALGSTLPVAESIDVIRAASA
jgi:hypothetical protein